jgi:hypothetical protein
MKIKLPISFTPSQEVFGKIWVVVDAEIVCIGLDAPLSFAVHKTTGYDLFGRKWTLSNIETGLGICRGHTKKDVIELASQLASQLVFENGADAFMRCSTKTHRAHA